MFLFFSQNVKKWTKLTFIKINSNDFYIDDIQYQFFGFFLQNLFCILFEFGFG